MDEQQILAVLREHVARSQNGPAMLSSGDARLHLYRVDVPKLEQASAELWRLHGSVGRLNPRNAGFVNRTVQAFKRALQRSLSWYTRSLLDYQDAVNRGFENHAAAIASLQQQILDLGGGLPEVLQETLRTARRATQEQLAPYARLFRGRSPVLDLGCGRGEFLELLKEEGVSAHGVDSDRLACEEARHHSLNVVEEDLFDHLMQVSERSLGGIFCSRVIEYLPQHLQAELVALCARKLQSGGLLVIETLNPDSDFPFGRNSHVDPSHVRALYPEVLRSMVESNGFDECSIHVLAPQPVCLAVANDGSRTSAKDGSGNGMRETGLLRDPAYAAVAHRS
ncbi:MAG TPA: methyltransferase domain-containing protein [Bryocella sp.]|nr:methyltransferase domain-containing protein [Bryocella sp.]